MFFSSSIINNVNPFPPPPPLFPSFFSHYQHHQDLTTAGHDFFPAAISAPDPALESNTCLMIQQDNQMINGNRNSDPFMTNLLPAWKLIKKPAANHSNNDRHRKIVTAQGPRDRRVRLSIQIARKFFDLQDALGFDKASKTLDWLLTQSKSAIDELVNIKPLIGSTTADHEEAAEIGDTLLKRNKPLMSSAKKKRMTRQQQQNSTFPIFERESRAKTRERARERARERTREKMSTRKLNESKKFHPDLAPPIQPNLSSTWNQMSSHNTSMVPYFNVDTDQFNRQTIVESFMIKRKLKQSQNFSTNYQQNLSNSEHVSSNSPHVTENWDISNSFRQVNPSTADFQNCSKLRDIYNYQIMNQD